MWPKFYSEMFELKGGDGLPLFNTLRVGLACQKCIDEDKASSCTHMKDIIRKLIYTSIVFFDLC